MDLNQVTLIGRIGKEVKLEYTPSGDAVTKFSLATNKKWKGKDGVKLEKTTWHNIVVWKKQAEFIAEYAGKGDLILIEGTIDNRSYNDKDGVKKYISEVIAVRVQLGPKKNDSNKESQSFGPQSSTNTGKDDDEWLPF